MRTPPPRPPPHRNQKCRHRRRHTPPAQQQHSCRRPCLRPHQPRPRHPPVDPMLRQQAPRGPAGANNCPSTCRGRYDHSDRQRSRHRRRRRRPRACVASSCRTRPSHSCSAWRVHSREAGRLGSAAGGRPPPPAAAGARAGSSLAQRSLTSRRRPSWTTPYRQRRCGSRRTSAGG